MFLKMKAAFSGDFDCAVGDIIERPEAEALRFIAAGFARRATSGEVAAKKAAEKEAAEAEAALVAQAEKEAAEKEAETVQPAPGADIVVDSGPVA